MYTMFFCSFLRVAIIFYTIVSGHGYTNWAKLYQVLQEFCDGSGYKHDHCGICYS